MWPGAERTAKADVDAADGIVFRGGDFHRRVAALIAGVSRAPLPIQHRFGFRASAPIAGPRRERRRGRKDRFR